MKKYLVAYDTGNGVLKSSIVTTDDGYVPASDDCGLLKRLVCERDRPRETEILFKPFCNGMQGKVNTLKYLTCDGLSLIAVSSLDI